MPNFDDSLRSESTQSPLGFGEGSTQANFSNSLNLSSWPNKELGSIVVPPKFLQVAPQPKFSIGNCCRWIPMSTTDWGTVIGQVLAPVQSEPSRLSQWGWLYLVLLDLDSPSRLWVAADWADEEELELFHPPV